MTFLSNIHVRFWLFSLGLGLIIWVLQQVFPVIVHPKIWEILIFLVLFFFFIQLLNSFLLKVLPDSFFQISVLAMVLRLIGSLVFIGVEVWPGMENIILFIADFFAIFLFYLVFDIYAFLANLRPISK
ncbi:hypothetical protein [Algoriphagus confluentis]|uniref:Uncharacterized protein n=1 Tax=Algoriphagus confluentis TaxID=1697556 RepID=A0ABQ6PJ04_9BACT|nr:hypothetical protein Aconfl_05770 [Algoriphagus confluentis]